jgi:hypothetical protein
MADYVCQDPIFTAWKDLKEKFEKVGGNVECDAAVSVIERRLKCQVSDGHAFYAVRTAYWRAFTTLSGPAAKDIRDGLEDLCRIAPGLDDTKPSPMYKVSGLFEDAHLAYQTLAVLTEDAKHLRRLTRKNGDLSKEINSAKPLLVPADAQGLEQGFMELSGAADEVVTNARTTGTALASCDPQEVRDALEVLEGSVEQLAFAYGDFHCKLGRNKCLAPPVIYDTLHAKAETVGFYSANVVSAFGKLRVCETGLGAQLKAIWLVMRAQAGDQLKRAFEKWQERQLCPQSLCYDTATWALRKAVDEGITDSSTSLAGPACCSEPAILQHGRIVNRAIDEIQKIHCKTKNLANFDNCLLISLGSSAMRLHAALGRGATDITDRVKTMLESWADTKTWFADTSKPPSPRALHQLRKIVGIYHWLENKLQPAAGTAICCEPYLSGQYAAAGAYDPCACPSADVSSLSRSWDQREKFAAQLKSLVPSSLLPQAAELVQVATGEQLWLQSTTSQTPASVVLDRNRAQGDIFTAKMNAVLALAQGRASEDAKPKLAALGTQLAEQDRRIASTLGN